MEKITKEKKTLKTLFNYYDILDSLCKRLQDDYNGNKHFVQLEEDRIALSILLETFDELDNDE
jgi:hypothetical protein